MPPFFSNVRFVNAVKEASAARVRCYQIGYPTEWTVPDMHPDGVLWAVPAGTRHCVTGGLSQKCAMTVCSGQCLLVAGSVGACL